MYALKSGNKTEVQQTDALKRMIENKRDDRQYLQFPLAVGNKWTNEYKVDGVGKGSSYALIRRKADVQVVGFEEVITPAGAFKTYKIERNEVSTSGRIVYTYLYSPQTRSIVKLNYDARQLRANPGVTDIELIKFGSAGVNETTNK